MRRFSNHQLLLLFFFLLIFVASSTYVFYLYKDDLVNRILLDFGHELLTMDKYYNHLSSNRIDSLTGMPLRPGIHLKQNKTFSHNLKNEKFSPSGIDEYYVSELSKILEAFAFNPSLSETMITYSDTVIYLKKDKYDTINGIFFESTTFVKEKSRFSTLFQKWLFFVCSILIALFGAGHFFYHKQVNKLGKFLQNSPESLRGSVLPETRYPEFNFLIRSITIMREKFIEKIHQQASELDSLKGVIEAINEGIIVLDKNMRFVIVNKPANDILGLDVKNIIGKPSLNLILIPELRLLIEKTTIEDIGFFVKSRYYWASIHPEQINNFYILRILDISESHYNQKNRTDFVANVSHELRTPMTLIRGFAETLQLEELSNDQKRYVDTIIDIQTDYQT